MREFSIFFFLLEEILSVLSLTSVAVIVSNEKK